MDFESICQWAFKQGYRASTLSMLRKLDEEVAELKHEVEKATSHDCQLDEAADICIVLAAHYGDLLASRIAYKMNINQHDRKWFVKLDGTLGRDK